MWRPIDCPVSQIARSGIWENAGSGDFQSCFSRCFADSIKYPQVLLRWGLLQGCGVIPKTSQPSRVAEFSETHLLGPSWSQEQDQALLNRLASMADGQKYCWDPSEIR